MTPAGANRLSKYLLLVLLFSWRIDSVPADDMPSLDDQSAKQFEVFRRYVFTSTDPDELIKRLPGLDDRGFRLHILSDLSKSRLPDNALLFNSLIRALQGRAGGYGNPRYLSVPELHPLPDVTVFFFVDYKDRMYLQGQKVADQLSSRAENDPALFWSFEEKYSGCEQGVLFTERSYTSSVALVKLSYTPPSNSAHDRVFSDETIHCYVGAILYPLGVKNVINLEINSVSHQLGTKYPTHFVIDPKVTWAIDMLYTEEFRGIRSQKEAKSAFMELGQKGRAPEK